MVIGTRGQLYCVEKGKFSMPSPNEITKNSRTVILIIIAQSFPLYTILFRETIII